MSDLDTIAANVREAEQWLDAVGHVEAEIERLRASASRRSARLAALRDVRGKAQVRAELKRHLARTTERITDAEKRHKELLMQKPDLEYTAPAAQSSWPWVCWVPLTFGTVRYARGEIVPLEVLEASPNFDRLVHGGYVRQRSPSARPLKRVAAPPPIVVTVPPPIDHVAECRAALRRAAAERGCTLRTALDLVDRGLLNRAVSQIAEMPRKARANGMTEGGFTTVASGRGTMRRITDDAYDVLCAAEPSTGENDAAHPA
jgi:hypothetical protein